MPTQRQPGYYWVKQRAAFERWPSSLKNENSWPIFEFAFKLGAGVPDNELFNKFDREANVLTPEELLSDVECPECKSQMDYLGSKGSNVTYCKKCKIMTRANIALAKETKIANRIIDQAFEICREVIPAYPPDSREIIDYKPKFITFLNDPLSFQEMGDFMDEFANEAMRKIEAERLKAESEFGEPAIVVSLESKYNTDTFSYSYEAKFGRKSVYDKINPTNADAGELTTLTA